MPTMRKICKTMEHQQLPNNGIEHRFAAADFEARQEGEQTRFRGYALRFGVVYDMGWFTEEVDKNALSNSDLADVRILFNHDPNQILGRTTAKTAIVGVDDIGLWYDFTPPESPNGENARVAISRGDITQSSWGFRLRQDATGRRTGDRWEMRNGKEHRILTDVSEVLDASPVTFPANPDTSIAKRSRDAALDVAPPDQAPPPQPDPGITETFNRLTRALDRKLAIQTKHK